MAAILAWPAGRAALAGLIPAAAWPEWLLDVVAALAGHTEMAPGGVWAVSGVGGRGWMQMAPRRRLGGHTRRTSWMELR